jgi:hypothetical protein
MPTVKEDLVVLADSGHSSPVQRDSQHVARTEASVDPRIAQRNPAIEGSGPRLWPDARCLETWGCLQRRVVAAKPAALYSRCMLLEPRVREVRGSLAPML